jgi:ubiquinone/menaquinone biosynthesis C-methylase UbiE
MRADNIQDFNRWSSTYEDSWLQRHYFDYVHGGVLHLVDTESTFTGILDIGCGTGRLLRKIKERYPDAQLIGVDPAEGMIEKARQLMPDATFSVGLAESIPLPDASVDLALSTMSFHHWSDQLQGICEIKRVLRPGGRFLLADVAGVILPKIIHHGQMRNPTEVRLLFEQAGLEVRIQRRLMLGHVLVTAGIRH